MFTLNSTSKEDPGLTDQSLVNFDAPCVVQENNTQVGTGTGTDTHTNSDNEEGSKLKKMKKWPSDPTAMVNYKALIEPCKKIIDQGYKLTRNKVRNFEYEGFNIGKIEKRICPPPNFRFTEKFLEHDRKNNLTLLDAVLQTVFLLGIEQGRRAERKGKQNVDELIAAMDRYRKDNRKLRYQIDVLKVKADVEKDNHTEASVSDLINERVAALKYKRIEEARQELGKDPLKAFKCKEHNKASFKVLEQVAKSLIDKNKITIEQWEECLKQRGWTLEEWSSQCKKKKVELSFHKET